jgi:VRR-NUC domain.
MPISTEHQEQALLIQMVRLAAQTDHRLSLLFAIPNGGHRHILTAQKLKDEGVKSGVPDLFLPVAIAPYHGLFIEMKRRTGGKLSPNQKQWINALLKQGYKVVVANGASEAWSALREYLKPTEQVQ